MLVSLKSYIRKVLCAVCSFGINCYGGPLGFAFAVNGFWMFQYALSKCWVTVLSIYLGYATSWTEAHNM